MVKKKSVKMVLKKLGSTDAERSNVSEVIFSKTSQSSAESSQTKAVKKIPTSENDSDQNEGFLDPTSLYLKEIGFHEKFEKSN